MGLLIDLEAMLNEMTEDMQDGPVPLTCRVLVNGKCRLERHSRIGNQTVNES